MIKLEEGKSYRDRRGNIHGPLLKFSRETPWPFYVIDADSGERSWTENGIYSAEREASEYDLIEEVSGIEEFIDKPVEIKLTMKEKRKPIQMVVSPVTKEIFVLCNDGSMWVSYNKKWERVKPIPQPKKK